MKHLDVKIFGLVQGVYFRATAKEIAKMMKLSGWIKNEVDGSVSIEVEGENAKVDSFFDWCKKGPPSAKVDRWEVKESPVRGHESFEILN